MYLGQGTLRKKETSGLFGNPTLLEADGAIPDDVGIILVMRNKEGGCFALAEEVECEIPKTIP